jgi:hypothetical protein
MTQEITALSGAEALDGVPVLRSKLGIVRSAAFRNSLQVAEGHFDRVQVG